MLGGALSTAVMMGLLCRRRAAGALDRTGRERRRTAAETRPLTAEDEERWGAGGLPLRTVAPEEYDDDDAVADATAVKVVPSVASLLAKWEAQSRSHP